MQFSLRILALCFCAAFVSRADAADDSFHVAATKTELIFTTAKHRSPWKIFEVPPGQTNWLRSNAVPLADLGTKRKIAVPRFDGERDRVYSGFIVRADAAALATGVKRNFQKGGELLRQFPTNQPVRLAHSEIPLGKELPAKFVESFINISLNRDAYPNPKSKKGLQVQMIDDAIALGVKHAALNFNFGQMVALHPAANDFAWKSDGRIFHFNRGYIEGNDRSVKTLSDTGALVTLILLNYEGGDTNLNKILLHPDYDPACPNKLSAFNTVTPEGVAWFKACVEFLAARYSETGYPHGRVVNYIVGNEVNSHWHWANMGKVSMEQFTRDYLRTVRLCNTAVRKFSASDRVFISLEHHWNMRGGKPQKSFPGRDFIDLFNQLAKEQGDFDWNLAFHPYPENLFEPRTWNDKSATFNDDTPRITFKNLEMLTDYFRRTELRFDGKPRHIILSEQGFHSDGTPEGELAQAAGYAYAYYKIARLDGIDAFILHRHVDHPHEGGLNLGLWRRDPMTKKPIYEVFRAADTPEWKEAFEFALPIIGIQSWKEIDPHRH